MSAYQNWKLLCRDQNFYFLCISHCLMTLYDGQHIGDALKVISSKIYPHVLNYSTINLTCVQLILVDCIDWAIRGFPLINNTSYKILGVCISIFIFPLDCRPIYLITSLKFSTGCLIAKSNLVCLKFLFFFPKLMFPSVHLNN